MNWLITGGCGFIGRNLIHSLLEDGGHRIRVLDNLKTGTRADLAMVADAFEGGSGHALTAEFRPGVELVVADILDAPALEAAAQGADVIVHLAANTGVAPSVADPKMDCHVNVVGTLNCLEAARACGVKKFVFASSGAPAGEVEPPIHEELVPHPVSPYGASKLAGEAYCSCYHKTFGIDTVALRFGNVYGELSGHKDSVVAKFIRRAMEGETLEIYGTGSQTRDFIYIGDLVRAIRLSVNTPGVGGEVFQIATGAETTIHALVDVMVPLLEARGIGPVQVEHGEARLGDVMRNYSDTSKAARMLGWHIAMELPEGLEKTINWFVQRAS